MKAEKIKYAMGKLIAEGALVYDDSVSGKRPAMLMAPNWMGMTDKAIERAKLVAGDRYVVFVADMYGEGKRPSDFGGAAALANPLRENAVEQRARIRAAYDAMIAEAGKRDLIDDRRAAIGFCFGGGNVLELARDGADIAAVVAIHSDLITAEPAKKGTIKAKLLVTHGAPDPVAPKEHRDAFEKEMDAAGAQLGNAAVLGHPACLHRSRRGCARYRRLARAIDAADLYARASVRRRRVRRKALGLFGLSVCCSCLDFSWTMIRSD